MKKPLATFSPAFIWSALWLGLNEDTPYLEEFQSLLTSRVYVGV